MKKKKLQFPEGIITEITEKWNRKLLITIFTVQQQRILKGALKKKSEVKVLVAQSCLTLCNPMDYSMLGSSIH